MQKAWNTNIGAWSCSLKNSRNVGSGISKVFAPHFANSVLASLALMPVPLLDRSTQSIAAVLAHSRVPAEADVACGAIGCGPRLRSAVLVQRSRFSTRNAV